jgi:dTDP-4-dehydrorhamnose reductase
MKILVLGHTGMLGRTVVSYLQQEGVDVYTITARWGAVDFEKKIRNCKPDFIINCIGIIPQKSPRASEYQVINVLLPRFLETLGIPVIHPSTDCEFNGRLEVGKTYTKQSVRDADDAYGKSKADISKEIETDFKNTKIIRTSIIGHEATSNVALLDWFLSQNGVTRGYTNHYWNGITTLQWAKQAYSLITNWDSFPVLNQYAVATDSKYNLLVKISKIYNKEIDIISFETIETVNKCLTSDTDLPTIEDQLRELRGFFKK